MVSAHAICHCAVPLCAGFSRTVAELSRRADGSRAAGRVRVPVRRFALKLTTGGRTTPGRLAPDAGRMPALPELVFRQGSQVFRRLRWRPVWGPCWPPWT